MTEEGSVSIYKTEQQTDPCTPTREEKPGISEIQNSLVNPEFLLATLGQRMASPKVLHTSIALDGGAVENQGG